MPSSRTSRSSQAGSTPGARSSRLDGEITGPAGGVQWRELTGIDDDEVLVKGEAGVTTTTRAAFLAGLVS
ncbi:phosphoribosyl-dephospho-CoA transferase MdcG domain-containing protein [Bradyrhizobium sp. DOA9]|uniref:phosphoribosyl-dephospho-CoA transferase MdcG domain-containing protein n=1 Tax=Bradyrhizobium sp. DOA9 TaxID=1126627 RepID=UPI0030EEFCF6